jgi:AraC-like DNA-binding protein
MGRHRNRLLAIPRGELEPFLLDPGVAVNARIANGSPIAVVLSAHLDALWQVANKVDGNVGAALVEDVCRLLALALNSRTSNVDVAGASKTCTQCHPALVAIDRNFEDPSLTPSHVAAELGISRRSLHRLFEDLGVTFSQCLRRRRLAAARRLIAGTRMTITDIAFASGFNDLSTFRRAVRAHYGMAPRDLRRLLVATGPEQMKLPKRDGEDSNHRQPAAPPSALGPQTP